jgi:hypothetical protein
MRRGILEVPQGFWLYRLPTPILNKPGTYA